MTLTKKMLLAGLSGLLVSLAWLVLSRYESESEISALLVYGVCGAVFAAGVLLPYAQPGSRFVLRAAGLIAVSGASFYFAVGSAVDWYSGTMGPELEHYVVASLIGATIVYACAPALLALRYSVKLLVGAVIAAAAGGVAFGLFAEAEIYGFYLAFSAWHILVCLPLHFASAQRADSGWWVALGQKAARTLVGIVSFIVALPLIDDGVGALLHSRYIDHEGGLFVHEAVEAHGFLDSREKPFISRDCEFACLTPIGEDVYAFQEYVVSDAAGQYLLFFVGEDSDPNCNQYDNNWTPPLKTTSSFGSRPRGDRCMTYRLSHQRTAIFAVRSESLTVDALGGIYSLRKTVRQVVRLADDKVVAEAIYITNSSHIFGTSFGSIEKWDVFLKQALPRATGQWSEHDKSVPDANRR